MSTGHRLRLALAFCAHTEVKVERRGSVSAEAMAKADGEGCLRP